MRISVLYVCLGNICRSPAAEGMLKHLIQQRKGDLDIHVESCGLGDWHVGQLPDERMRRATERRGFVLTSQAQAFHEKYFDDFDYIFASDQEVRSELYQLAKNAEQKSKIHLMTKFSDIYQGTDVPDPYYEMDAAFDQVLDILEESCAGTLDHLENSTN